jgi:hypothetical protein
MLSSQRGLRAVRACTAAAWIAALFIATGAHAQFVSIEAASVAAPPTALTRAAIMVSASRVPPPDTAPWKDTTLPDNWHFSRPDFRGTVWYRIPFDVPANARVTHALYMPRNSATQMVFWMNRERLSLSTSYGDPRLTELSGR